MKSVPFHPLFCAGAACSLGEELRRWARRPPALGRAGRFGGVSTRAWRFSRWRRPFRRRGRAGRARAAGWTSSARIFSSAARSSSPSASSAGCERRTCCSPMRSSSPRVPGARLPVEAHARRARRRSSSRGRARQPDRRAARPRRAVAKRRRLRERGPRPCRDRSRTRAPARRAPCSLASIGPVVHRRRAGLPARLRPPSRAPRARARAPWWRAPSARGDLAVEADLEPDPAHAGEITVLQDARRKRAELDAAHEGAVGAPLVDQDVLAAPLREWSRAGGSRWGRGAGLPSLRLVR